MNNETKPALPEDQLKRLAFLRLSNAEKMKHCVFCGEEFEPNEAGHINCGGKLLDVKLPAPAEDGIGAIKLSGDKRIDCKLHGVKYGYCEECAFPKEGGPAGGIATKQRRHSIEDVSRVLSVEPTAPVVLNCGCKGEMHDANCACTCTDSSKDPWCRIHSLSVQPAPVVVHNEFIHIDDMKGYTQGLLAASLLVNPDINIHSAPVSSALIAVQQKIRIAAQNAKKLAESPVVVPDEPAICPKCNCPHYNMEDSEFCRSMFEPSAAPAYPRWECFHCGFKTSEYNEAAAHFGDRDDAEEFKPLCKWWQRMGDGERAEAFQDVIQQLNDALTAQPAPLPSDQRKRPSNCQIAEMITVEVSESESSINADDTPKLYDIVLKVLNEADSAALPGGQKETCGCRKFCDCPAFPKLHCHFCRANMEAV